MHTTIQKWGNSLALRIPLHVARKLALKPGVAIDMTLENSGLLIKPCKQDDLETLLSQITEQNCHHEVLDDDSHRGNELW
jgi:antitoxin MazE